MRWTAGAAALLAATARWLKIAMFRSVLQQVYLQVHKAVNVYVCHVPVQCHPACLGSVSGRG